MKIKVRNEVSPDFAGYVMNTYPLRSVFILSKKVSSSNDTKDVPANQDGHNN